MDGTVAKDAQRTGHTTGLAVLVALLAIATSVLRLTVLSHDESSTFSFRPELYHGEGKTHHFFEGWYHKLVRTRAICKRNGDALAAGGGDESLSMAVVPGVFYDSGNNITGKNESHAFIFVTINGEKQHYYRFDLETEFRYLRHDSHTEDDNDFYVEIGKNRFSKHGISLDLVPRCIENDIKNRDSKKGSCYGDSDDATISIQGSVEYKEISPWPIPSAWNLGAMGPVGYFLSPFLECYHDVLSFDHRIEGKLVISNHVYDNKNEEQTHSSETASETGNVEEFLNSKCSSDGTYISSRGYVEKDRGRSFPSLWIWMQSNSFRKQLQHSRTSLFFSVARIPILSKYLKKFLPKSLGELEFPGFTAAIWLNIGENGENGENASTGKEDQTLSSTDAVNTTEKLIPFATWTGAYFEDLIVEDERVVATLNSGGIGRGFWRSSPTSERRNLQASDKIDAIDSIIILVGRFMRAWIGSWFLNYDSRKFRYRLELVADRNAPHVLLYAPKTTIVTNENGSPSISSASKMEPFVNEALNANISVRLFEYYLDADGEERERLLLDDVGEHAGLEVHQNVQYLVENLCDKAKANKLVCL